jgi:hypothetical protein
MKISYDKNGKNTISTVFGVNISKKPVKLEQSKQSKKIKVTRSKEKLIKNDDSDNDNSEINNDDSAKTSGKLDKYLKLLKQYFKYYEIIKNYSNKKEILALTLVLLKKLFKALHLKIYNLHLQLGQDESYKTGQLLAICGIVFGIFSLDVDVEGDFEKEIFNVSGNAKGYTNLASIILPIVDFILKKPILKIVKTLMKKS